MLNYVVIFSFVLIGIITIHFEVKTRNLHQHIGELYSGAYKLMEEHPEIHYEYFGEYPEIEENIRGIWDNGKLYRTLNFELDTQDYLPVYKTTSYRDYKISQNDLYKSIQFQEDVYILLDYKIRKMIQIEPIKVIGDRFLVFKTDFLGFENPSKPMIGGYIKVLLNGEERISLKYTNIIYYTDSYEHIVSIANMFLNSMKLNDEN